MEDFDPQDESTPIETETPGADPTEVSFMDDFGTEEDELLEAVDEVAQDMESVEGEPEMPADLPPELEARWIEEQKAFRRGITGKGQELSETKKQLEQYQAMLQDPATLRKILGLEGQGQAQTQNNTFDPYADVEISEEFQAFQPEMEKVAWTALEKHLLPQLRQGFAMLQQMQQQQEEAGFNQFKQENPAAEKYQKEIKAFQAKGLTYEQALHAAAGTELIEEAKATTAGKRTAKPQPRPTIQPGRAGTPPVKAPKGQSLKEILRNAERQQGYSFR